MLLEAGGRAHETRDKDEEHYRFIVEQLGEGIGILDEELRFLFVNRAARQIFDYPPFSEQDLNQQDLGRQDLSQQDPARQDLIGRNLKDFIDKNSLKILRNKKQGKGLPAQNEPIRLPRLGIRLPGGKKRYVQLTLTPFQAGPGSNRQVLAEFRDITEQIRREARQDAILSISEAALSAQNPNALYRSLHRIIAALIPAKNCFIALYHPEIDRFTYPYWIDQEDPRPLAYTIGGKGLTAYVVRSGKPLLTTEEELKRLQQEGELEPLGTLARYWLGVPLKIRQKIIGVMVVQAYEEEAPPYTEEDRDLLSFVSTQIAMAIERLRAEEALREREERYRELFEHANDIICTRDLRGKITAFNPAGECILGYSQEEALKMDWNQLLAPESRNNISPLTWEGGIRREELVLLTREGHRIRIENSAWLTYHKGEPRGVQSIARDITRRTQLEEQLRQLQKMEAVGRLAGGIAHDFNNLLVIINGYSSLILDSADPHSELYENLKEIQEAGQRAANLTRQLLAFSRRQIVEYRILDLNHELRSMQEMLDRLLGEDITLEMILDPQLGGIQADTGQIGQVVANLAVNARDAMPKGGCLRLETREVALEKELVTPQDRIAPGDYVQLLVSDTGSGIPRELLEHIFEPFFTTKVQGQGTGLGLSTVYGIIKQHGGAIKVESRPGKGTCFHIYFPLCEKARPQGREKQLNPIPGGGEIVLVVEDEASVRKYTVRVLEQLGYKVLEAADGAAALDLCRCRAEPIDLVLTDVVMPDMNGRQLVDHLLHWRQDFKVLYMSGYTDEIVTDRGGLQAGIQLLQKPFDPAQLALQVRRALDSPGLS